MARTKTATKTAPAKRVPTHGHGQLLTGGLPGNKGGTGRPPALLRSLAREVCEPALLEMQRRLTPKRKCKKCGHAPNVAELTPQDVARIAQVAGTIGLSDQVPGEEYLRQASEGFQWAVRKAVGETFTPSQKQWDAFEATLGQLLLEVVQTRRSQRQLAATPA